MLLTIKNDYDILHAKSGERPDWKLSYARRQTMPTATTPFKEVWDMDIYEKLNQIDDEQTAYGVNPLSYVVLDCGR